MDEALALFNDQYQIFAQRFKEKPYAVRFIGPPYRDSESDSIRVYGHGRNPDRLSAASIISVLVKFEKTKEDFKEKYNEFYRTRGSS